MPKKQPNYVFHGTKSFKGFTVHANKSLQRPDMSLGSLLYNGIEIFCQHLRDEFGTIEKDGL